ncbi:hypothetical protein AgCh_016903 [Apium graveolens]
MLLQEENHRSVMNTYTTTSDYVAMTVKNGFPKVPTSRFLKKGAHDNKENVQCEYCHMPGHSKDKCYCLHGNPTWHKLYGKSKPKPQFANLAKANSVVQSSGSELQSSVSISPEVVMPKSSTFPFSEDQCKQLNHCILLSLQAWCIILLAQFILVYSNVTPFTSDLHLPNGASATITHEEFIRNKPRVCGIGCGKLGAERSKIRSRIQNFTEGAWVPAQGAGAAAWELGRPLRHLGRPLRDENFNTEFYNPYSDGLLRWLVLRLLSVDGLLKSTSLVCDHCQSAKVEQLFPLTTSYSECDPLYEVVSIPSTEVSSSSEILPPASTRPVQTHTLPVHFADYTGLPAHLAQSISVPCGFSASTMKLCNLDDYISALSVHFFDLQFGANSVTILEPTSYKEAVKHPQWCEAMMLELSALEANNTWELQPLPLLGRKHALIFTQVYAFASNIEYFLVRSLRDSD